MRPHDGNHDDERPGRDATVWSSPEWQAMAVAWVDEKLAATGERRIGAATARVRAWSAVLRVPTTGGTVWLKATSRVTGAEVALYGVLTSTAPDRVLHPIATDAARGWVLLPDGGTSLAEVLDGTGALDGTDVLGLLEHILPHYAQVQLALAPRADDLLALGLADMRPGRASDRFDEAAAAVLALLRPGDEERYANALAHRDAFVSWADRLAASPVPASIDHNDLHADNVLLPATDPGKSVRFYDWGDSVVAHPFTTMLHGLGWVAAYLGVDDRDPAILRLRDAYLAPFSGYGSPAELAETLEVACRVAKVARCLSWARAIELGDEARGFERAPVELFASIPDDSYLSPI